MQSCEPVQVATLVTSLLDKLGVRHAIAGSLASSFHGVPRATQDVDIVAAMTGSHVEGFVSDLKNDFYVDENMIREAVADFSCFNIIHLATMFKVDIFVISPSGHELVELEHAEQHLIEKSEGLNLTILSAEDTIARKLKWYRMGQEISSQQWNDVLGILRVQEGRLKLDYLQKAATRLGVQDLLKRACADSEITL